MCTNEQWAAPRTRMKIKNRGHSERAWSLAFVRLPATVKGPGYTTTFWVFKQVSLYYNTYFVAEFYQHYFLKWPRLAKASILFSQTCKYAHVIYWRLTMLTKFHFKFPAHDMILHVTRFLYKCTLCFPRALILLMRLSKFLIYMWHILIFIQYAF